MFSAPRWRTLQLLTCLVVSLSLPRTSLLTRSLVAATQPGFSTSPAQSTLTPRRWEGVKMLDQWEKSLQTRLWRQDLVTGN